MMIYDIVHVGQDTVTAQVRELFRKNKDIKDPRVIDMLIEKGYIDLEDTLLQHKQKTHLMALLEGTVGTDQNRYHSTLTCIRSKVWMSIAEAYLLFVSLFSSCFLFLSNRKVMSDPSEDEQWARMT